MIYRNDDGVSASIESTVFRVDGGDSIVCVTDRLAKSRANRLPHFLVDSPRNSDGGDYSSTMRE